MKTKIFALILAFCMLFLASCSLLNSGEVVDTSKEESLSALMGGSEGLEYEVSATNPNQCVITGVGTCTDKDIKIPSTIDGKLVV